MPESLVRALFLLLFAPAVVAQPIVNVSTLCQGEPVVVHSAPVWRDQRLIGCGEGFPNNLLWHLDRSDNAAGVLDQVERRRVTGRGAVVYLIDSGVRADHDEFARPTGSNVIAGIDIDHIFGCQVLSPCSSSLLQIVNGGHGTATASIIAGRRTGVAPDASIVAVRNLSNEDALWVAALKAVIAHAHAPTTPPFRTAVVSLSASPGFGRAVAPQTEIYLRRMIGGVDAEGNPDPNGKRFLFVSAAGNLGREGEIDPNHLGHCTREQGVALFPTILAPEIDGLISVGGLTRENRQWEGGCKGPLVEVLAPAADMFLASSTGRDHYRFEPSILSGTSYGAPYVAGMAARLLEVDPTLTPAQLEQSLKASPSLVDGKPVPVMVYSRGKRRAVR